MDPAVFDTSTDALRPLEFIDGTVFVACTPKAVDLALLAFAGYGFGYYSAKAGYHNGRFEGREDLPDGAGVPEVVLSAADLVSVRAAGVTGAIPG